MSVDELDAIYVVASCVVLASLCIYLIGLCVKQVSRTTQSDALCTKDSLATASVDQTALPVSEHPPHLQGTFFPSTGLIRSNGPAAYAFENENASGCMLPLHAATYDKERLASGEYPYGSHFKGRRRNWEIRLQIKFKSTPVDSLRFGIELDEYVPLNGTAKGLMKMTVAALRRVVGNDLYHSPGDDPEVVTGPGEKPMFMMPLWAFDQFVVTPEGEEAPDLSSHDFHTLGMSRANGRQAFIKAIGALDIRAGPTYTFSFWGISQFLDNIKWEITKVVPFTTIDFNTFCGAPPVNVAMYSLKADGTEHAGDQRHLQSRKNYYFRMAFWSSKHKPDEKRLAELLPLGDVEASRCNSAITDVARKVVRSTPASSLKPGLHQRRAGPMAFLGDACARTCGSAGIPTTY